MVERRGRFAVAEPLFERGPQLGMARGSSAARAGEMVVVEPRPGGARVIARLGSPRVARDVAGALLWEGGLERGFRERVEAEADEAARAAPGGDLRRRDLTELATFTVDPATARDFDDAVSAAPEGEGVRLWIHIADVAAHVRPGTALEGEALRRATSVYVPGTVEPMLPATLSAGACSLTPGVERLAVTAEIVVGADGSPRSASFYRSLIRSDARLDYDRLDDIFAGRAEPPATIAAPLELARGAAASLADRRPRSAVEVETAEPEFEFDSDGAVTAARAVAQTEAHRLIEHLMILANERVAALLEERRIPTLYRVHAQPDPDRVALLADQLAALDVPTPPLPKRLTGREAGRLVGEISRWVTREAARRGHGAAALTTLVLRSLKQAYYSDRNLGHAGLGSPAYCHFTSPIRRYPDLVAHRALLAAVGAGEDAPERAAVAEAGPRSSEREREAIAIERRADRACAAFLLERELFDGGWDRSFEGEVSGVIGAGAFVRFAGEHADVYEGFLPVRRIWRERFELDPTETTLVGGRTGRRIRLADPLAVRVESIEAARGRVDLQPVGGA